MDKNQYNFAKNAYFFTRFFSLTSYYYAAWRQGVKILHIVFFYGEKISQKSSKNAFFTL